MSNAVEIDKMDIAAGSVIAQWLNICERNGCKIELSDAEDRKVRYVVTEGDETIPANAAEAVGGSMYVEDGWAHV